MEVFADGTPSAQVERIEHGGLVGFRFHEPGRSVVLLHNPTASPISVSAQQAGTAGTGAWKSYQDRQGEPQSLPPDAAISVAPHGQVLLARPDQ